METGLEDKPVWVLAIVAVVLAALVAGGGYYLQIRKMNDEIARQGTRIAELEDQIRRGEAAKAQLPQLQEKVAKLEQQLDRLLEILPDRRNVHVLLRQFRALAERGDFNLLRVQPGREIEQEYFNEWPITLTLEGTYHNLAKFFDRMSRFKRIINVDGLRISANRSPSPNRTIDASFVAKTFVYKEDEQLEQGAAQ
ncbi:MAG: type 4a pilus biogenesis protein PilO [Acidobacteriota bacterium]